MNRVRLKEKQWIARESARILIEEGIDDFQLARQKAARRLGFRLTESVPGKEEIELAVAEYHRLFRARIQDSHIRRLRGIALQAMTFLKAFSPRLVGSVVDGSAGQHSPIMIYLAADSPEAVLIAFLDAKIPFVESSRRCFMARKKMLYPALDFTVDETKIEVHMFPEIPFREYFQSRKSLDQSATVATVKKMLGDNRFGCERSKNPA
ncbi:MAG: hypothetical protein ACRER2_13005 [Methylococcales bacterium]